MRLTLLGAEGAMRRAEELRQRIANLSGDRFDPGSMGMGNLQTVDGKPATLTGNLTGSFAPMNPFSDGAVTGQATPALKQMIQQAARQAGVDENLFDALVSTESNYDPKARSRAGAMGLAQLMPDTAAGLGVTDPFDPAQNLKGGAQYLAQLLQQFGDARLALAAYNAGPSRVIKAGNQVPDIPETKRYVDKIMALVEARRR